MAWWREARFGMFIHWGVYAVPAGTYEGKQISGIGEWIMRRAEIPVDTYRGYAQEFNPVQYDPDAWVRLAKEAGMKYIVITSKHHDGFALFDSRVTDWDVVDATPYGKDLLRPLVEACKKHGLKIGFYYSQAQDWVHPGGAKSRIEEGEGWDEKHKGDFDKYLETIAYPQVKEILSGYDIDVLWWDTPVWMNTERAEKLIPLLSLRPGIVHNNRLGGGFPGDTDTPEQRIPATGIPGRDWETCMTMNGTWGFKSYDHNWKSTQQLIRNLIDIASKGGNYLLNVGPTKEGLIPEPSIERLKEIGQWMKVNGESIYATTASPFTQLPWGRCTKKVHEDGATLYLHVFDWPDEGKLMIPGLRNRVTSAHMLAGGQALEVTPGAEGVVVALPETAPDPVATVVVLEVEGPLDIAKNLIKPEADGSIVLPALRANLHGREVKLEDKYGRPTIGYWTDSHASVTWDVEVEQPGRYEVVAEVAAPEESKATILVAGEQLAVTFARTGGYDAFQPQVLGTIRIGKPGEQQVAIQPVRRGWQAVNVGQVTLRPRP
jgi:alpha-L-fucosidase